MKSLSILAVASILTVSGHAVADAPIRLSPDSELAVALNILLPNDPSAPFGKSIKKAVALGTPSYLVECVSSEHVGRGGLFALFEGCTVTPAAKATDGTPTLTFAQLIEQAVHTSVSGDPEH